MTNRLSPRRRRAARKGSAVASCVTGNLSSDPARNIAPAHVGRDAVEAAAIFKTARVPQGAVYSAKVVRPWLSRRYARWAKS